MVNLLRADAPFDVLPRDVPGYREAIARGLVRPTPAGPPDLLPGRAASTIVWWVVGEFAAAIVTAAVVSKVLLRGSPVAEAGAAGWAFVATLLFWVGVLALEVRAVVRRLTAELDAGYLSTRVLAAQLSWRRNTHYGRQFAYGEMQTPWNCAGIWVLAARTGHVIQVPDRAYDAPGFYPSPYRPGFLELWTGAGWADQYRPMSD